MILTKVIANSPPLTYDSESEQVADDEASSKEKEIDKLIALISMSFKKIYKPTNNNLRTSSNTRNMNVDNTSRSDKRTGECKKPKRARESAYHNEKMLLCKQEEAEIQEVMPDAADNSGPIFDVEPLQKDDNNTSPDSSNMCSDEGEAD
ncbi:hypothetical protein Tco_0303328 [Tanacetum coccineum]